MTILNPNFFSRILTSWFFVFVMSQFTVERDMSFIGPKPDAHFFAFSFDIPLLSKFAKKYFCNVHHVLNVFSTFMLLASNSNVNVAKIKGFSLNRSFVRRTAVPKNFSDLEIFLKIS